MKKKKSDIKYLGIFSDGTCLLHKRKDKLKKLGAIYTKKMYKQRLKTYKKNDIAPIQMLPPEFNLRLTDRKIVYPRFGEYIEVDMTNIDVSRVEGLPDPAFSVHTHIIGIEKGRE